MAGGQGVEPRCRGPEPRVLPLHHPPTLLANEIDYSKKE